MGCGIPDIQFGQCLSPLEVTHDLKESKHEGHLRSYYIPPCYNNIMVNNNVMVACLGNWYPMLSYAMMMMVVE
jgi:hypothetical protein